ncbi:signal recognition particle, SRP19 subunit [Coniochaeta ligniaria NRRL 30616]|uniref:Signal recognition particle, SRP19 subunit n=1 Tax=Coniochaeta ligniaria NRRL 30616 TaxID=1408157 RepID=A0A1J7JFD7_9PEZI|nr:signal recognition particle, SRP19 subunit [Coniochaeta ligniaria NRRL 30616]
MSHPRIEEVSDSDVDMSDPSEGDIDDFAEEDIMRRVSPAPKPSQPPPNANPKSHILPPSQLPITGQQQHPTAASPAVYAGYQVLYPVYFDASRSRAQGRRVSSSQAVSNPLAVEIAAACQKLRLNPVLEPTKLHPKDWGNPGRVRVLIKEPAKGGPVAPGAGAVNNKHHLYLLVAQHLKENPTTEKSSSLWWRLPGHQGGVAAPDPAKPWPRPAVPRGWKVNELVPYWSPAVTGGGVSENLFKDMMKEMQGAGGGGGGGGGMPDMASLLAGAAGGAGGGGGGEGAAKKKDRKGKGKG